MIEIKIPKKLKVGGFDYSLEMSEYHDRELWDAENWGEHSVKLRRIRISTGCSVQQFSETFWHEIIHAVDTVYQGSKLSNDEVAALSNGLFQVLEQLGVRIVQRKPLVGITRQKKKVIPHSPLIGH